MLLTVFLMVAALQLTTADHNEWESPVLNGPHGYGRRAEEGGDDGYTVCIRYEDTGKEDCHPVDETGLVVKKNVDVQQSGCVILEYHLSYTSLYFEACDDPGHCIKSGPICDPRYQGVQIGAPQYIFLGPANTFYLVRLMGTSLGMCFQTDPDLISCDMLPSDCVILEYHLSYTSLFFEACENPQSCIKSGDICDPSFQGTQIGAPQHVFLNAVFHTIRLFGNSQGQCFEATPALPSCAYTSELVEV